MDTEKCPFIGIDCEYIPLARKSDAQAKEIERLRKVLQQITELSPFKFNTGYASLQYITQMLIEMTALAHEALREKE
jgi:hypothetical protein